MMYGKIEDIVVINETVILSFLNPGILILIILHMPSHPLLLLNLYRRKLFNILVPCIQSTVSFLLIEICILYLPFHTEVLFEFMMYNL